jgi:NAD(P)-dependent dehydrogenase (short-subunit alcohol dehydrogenase family)
MKSMSRMMMSRTLKQVVLLVATVALLAQVSEGFGTNAPPPPHSNNRRQFFHEVVQQGAVVAAGGAALAVTPPPAFAANSDYYTPAAHSLDGKLMVVTGGTAGLGLATVKRLASGGAAVVLTSRTAPKGSEAVRAVQDYLQSKGIVNDKIYSAVLDLDDLESVKSFPGRLAASGVGNQKTNVLINNAGVMAIPDRQLTKDGFERTFQSNHLGHFVLTAKLMDQLAPDARVINVSSTAYLFAFKGMDFDNLEGEENYGPWSSYGQSKLANILFTKELQRRADQAGRSIKTYVLHPGAVQTDLARNMMGTEKWETIKKEGLKGWDAVLLGAAAKFTKTVEDGASTQIYLAASDNLPQDGGEFFVDMKDTKLLNFATDMDAAKRLWTVSEQLGKIDFKL